MCPEFIALAHTPGFMRQDFATNTHGEGRKKTIVDPRITHSTRATSIAVTNDEIL